jgi:hypothetical protein
MNDTSMGGDLQARQLCSLSNKLRNEMVQQNVTNPSDA